MKSILFAAAVLAAPIFAHAGEVYSSAGLPGVTIGYALAPVASIGLRADFTTFGTYRATRTISAMDYEFRGRSDRIALLADFFSHSGGIRFTGGLALHDAKLDAQGRGNGGQVKIGDTYYPATASDGFNATARFPRVMPYLGLGYGHAPSLGKGWDVLFDLGLSVGKAKVTSNTYGNLSQTVSQRAGCEPDPAICGACLLRSEQRPSRGRRAEATNFNRDIACAPTPLYTPRLGALRANNCTHEATQRARRRRRNANHDLSSPKQPKRST